MAKKRSSKPATIPPISALTEQATNGIGTRPFTYAQPMSGLLYGNGGCSTNPLGFKGYGRPYLETLETFAMMLNDPVVHVTRTQSVAPVLASSWNYEATRDGIPKSILKRLLAGLKRDFDQLRRKIVFHAMQGRDFARAAMEPVWDVAGGEYRLVDMVPLAVEFTGVYRDFKGRFVGLAIPFAMDTNMAGLTIGINEVNTTLPGLPAPYKAWLYVYDDKARTLEGRSWLRHALVPWRDKLDAMQQLQILVAKVSGRQFIGKGPARNIPGTTTTYADHYATMMQGLSEGATGAFIPTIDLPIGGPGGMPIEKLSAEILRASLFSFDVLDFGNNSSAISSVLARISYDDQGIVLAGGKAARTALEGEFGARSETETKTEQGTIISELLNDDIADQLQPLVDSWCVLNEGEQYRGAMRIVCPPLDAAKASERANLMNGILSMGNANVQAIMLQKLGSSFFEQECSDCGAAFNADFNMDDAFSKLTIPPEPPPHNSSPTEPLVSDVTSRARNLLDNLDKARGQTNTTN